MAALMGLKKKRFVFREIKCERRSCLEKVIETATSVYDRPIHKLCLIARKEVLSNET